MVFSWNEIECGKIPQPSDFTTVISRIRQDLGATDGVVGAILYGSVFWNGYNQRSDIDCVVVYDPTKRHEIVQVLRSINRIATDLHVPAELIPIDSHTARTPLHHINLSLAVHLRYATENGGLIKTNPLPLFTFDDASILEDVRGYLRNKLRRLEKGMSAFPTMEDAELHRFLQKVLEAPVHVARKILWWQKAETPDDTKRTVMRYYPNIASAQERKLFANVTAADNQYTTELLAQLQNPDKNRYFQSIEAVKDLAWDTLEFVRLTLCVSSRSASVCTAKDAVRAI